jgi:hypothetical protein
VNASCRGCSVVVSLILDPILVLPEILLRKVKLKQSQGLTEALGSGGTNIHGKHVKCVAWSICDVAPMDEKRIRMNESWINCR